MRNCLSLCFVFEWKTILIQIKIIFFFIPYPPICGHPIAIFAPENDYKPLKTYAYGILVG